MSGFLLILSVFKSNTYNLNFYRHGSHIFSDTKSDSFDSENYFLDELIKVIILSH